jgi:endonuclease/exonuclease/phosphatase family metal-dependent hydrolase
MKRRIMRGKTASGMVLAVLLAGLTAGCEVSGGEEQTGGHGDSIAIMTWNLQALFDGVEAGNEYEEYRESAGWSREKYSGRLNIIAGAIAGTERRPDIIALQEIESAEVLRDLAAALVSQGYGWTHFANLPGMSLGVGLISRFPLSGTKAHSVNIDGDTAPRPMLEARVITGSDAAGGGEAGGGDLLLFVCHWKSKLGGDDATESTRRASARIILRRLRELAESEPELPVIIMGDLNENYDEFYRRSGAAISALMPDDPRSADLTGLYTSGDDPDTAVIGKTQTDFIILSKSRPPATRYFPSGAVTLYSPWAAGLENGTYYYKNAWETIDHFLLAAPLFDKAGWEFENCAVVNWPPFANANGHPTAYNPKTGSGLSDHLPLLLMLQKAP